MLFIIFLSMAKNNNPDYRFNRLDIFLSLGGYLSRDNNSKKWKNKMTSLVLPECFLVIFCFRTLLCVALQNKLPVVSSRTYLFIKQYLRVSCRGIPFLSHNSDKCKTRQTIV